MAITAVSLRYFKKENRPCFSLFLKNLNQLAPTKRMFIIRQFASWKNLDGVFTHQLSMWNSSTMLWLWLCSYWVQFSLISLVNENLDFYGVLLLFPFYRSLCKHFKSLETVFTLSVYISSVNYRCLSSLVTSKTKEKCARNIYYCHSVHCEGAFMHG